MRLLLPFLSSFLLLLVPVESPAVLIQFEFSGVMTGGDPFTGRLTYDLAPTVVAPGFVWEPPYDPAIGIDITVGDQLFSSDDADIFLIEVEQGPASDFFFTASIPGAPLSLYLADSSRTAFDSEDLPTSLALEDFDQAYIGQVLLGPGDVSFLTMGTVQSLVQIPEPASGALVLAGLLVLAELTRRQILS
jgi:hypothetical protein